MSQTDPEQAFDELTEWVVVEMTRVRGDAVAERRVLDEVVRRYADIRKQVDPEEPWSYVTQFLNTDGTAFEKVRIPAFERVAGASTADRRRWCEAAGEVAMKLEAAFFAK